MFKYITLKWTVAAIAFIVCFDCLEGSSEEADEQLNKQLGAICSQKRELGKWTDWEKVEAQCLELIKDHNSPAEKGKIYTAIARLYSQEGYRFRSEDPRIPKAIKYCKEALQYPLDVIDGCEMNGGLADAMLIKYWNCPEEEFIKIRQEAITYCLTGLKLAVDHNAPKEYPEPPPRMTVYHIYPQKGPIYEEAVRKHKEQLAAHKKWEFLEKLYFQRKALTQRCVTLYSHKPYDIDEFKLTAEKILKGHEGAAKELIAEVEAEIARLNEREAEIARKEKGSISDQNDK